MTTLTSDKHVANLGDAVITALDGLRHYAVVVDQLPNGSRFDALRDKTPFYVTLCSLCDAYDAAKGYYDFTYPEERFAEAVLERGFPTCARCSGV